MTIYDDAVWAVIGAIPRNKQLLDSSSHQRHGSLIGDASWQVDAGKIKRPYMDKPSGNDNYATASFSSITLDAFSVAAWVRVSAWGPNATILFGSLHNVPWANDAIFWLQWQSTGRVMFRALAQITQSPANRTLPINEWAHVGASRNASDLTRLYLNGELVASGAMTGLRTTPAITVGKSQAYATPHCHYADTAVWDRELSAAEFATLAKPSYTPLGVHRSGYPLSRLVN